MGAQLVREVASKTNDVAGDGTTTATVLRRRSSKRAFRTWRRARNPIAVKQRHRQAVEKAVARDQETLPSRLQAQKEIAQVASIAANDAEIGDADRRRDGQSRQGRRHHGRGVQGHRDHPRGRRGNAVRQGLHLSVYGHRPERMEAILENPLILIHEKKIIGCRGPDPASGEDRRRCGKPLVIIAEDIDGDALATLVVNKLRGTLSMSRSRPPASATGARP